MFGKKKKRIQELELTVSELEEEKSQLNEENQRLIKEGHDLRKHIEEITSNLANINKNNNPAKVVQQTGERLLEILKESNESNSSYYGDMSLKHDELQNKLQQSHEKVHALYEFLIVCGRRIGYFEGLSSSEQIEIDWDKITTLVDAYNRYELTLSN